MTLPPGARRAMLEAWRCGLVLLVGAAWIILLYQVPAHHRVNIGGYDTAYVQGFSDPWRQEGPGIPSPPYLEGSDGAARWLRSRSFLLFPQAGLPAAVTLRLRGWHPAGEPPPVVAVLLNGHTLLGSIDAGDTWKEHTFTIAGGLLKASDVVIELRASAEPAPEAGSVPRAGVLLDRAAYHVAPGAGHIITPYPTQVGWGALALALLWLATGGGAVRTFFARCWWFALLLGALFLLVVRLPPPLYPYPLRWLLPTVVVVLVALIVLRHAPALLATLSRPAVADALALIGTGLWLAAVLVISQEHVTLSVPGVEKDFRVYATRAPHLEQILQADGFYNLGYPLLLWLVRPFTLHNSFLAGRVVAALSGALLLLAGYLLARSLLHTTAENREHEEENHTHGTATVAALLALLFLALSPLVVRYALYLGSDMPFAALSTLSLALLLLPWRGGRWLFVGVALAGGAAGGAFLMRHPGLVLLPWGILACQVPPAPRASPPTAGPARWLLAARRALPFVAGFALVALPQLIVNTAQTGQPLYSQHAKNIWLAVYGNIDWGRWPEVPDSIALHEVVLRDPARFASNWWRNIVRYIGAGAEDSSEFGRAIQVRLLHWPANWLAMGGLASWLVWLVRSKVQGEAGRWRSRHARIQQVLLLFLACYVVAVCVGFVLLRFFLPLAPLYAAAGAGAVQAAIDATPTEKRARWFVAVALLLLALMSGGVGLGARYVLSHQPADEAAMVRLIEEVVPPGEQVLARVAPGTPLAKYSAVAHRVVPWPADGSKGAVQARPAQGAAYLLWEEGQGALPPGAVQAGTAGRYTLYRLETP